MNARKQSGFTLLELMLAFAVGLMITVMVFVGYKSAKSDTDVRQQIDLLRYVISVADSLTMSRNDYLLPNGAGTTPLSASAITDLQSSENNLPIGSSGSGGQLWGPVGQVQVSTTSSTGAAQDLLTLTMTGVPTKSCIAIVGRMADGIYDIKVNDSLVKLSPAPDIASQGRSEADIGQATGLCAASDSSTVVLRKLKDINYSSFRHDVFSTLSPAEAAAITPLYTRTEAALAAREAAQAAL